MAKISIKYYLNDKLKSKTNEKQETVFPVYIRINYKRVLSRIRSIHIREYLSEKEFEDLDIQRICKYEIEIIQSFFEFAENIIPDFSLNKSKTNFGDLLDFFCYLRFFSFLENVKVNFITTEIRFNSLWLKVQDFLVNEKGLPIEFVMTFLNTNAGLYKEFEDDEFQYISLGRNETKYCNEVGILSDKEAAKFEFIELLSKYNFEKYRLPFERDRKHNPNPHAFLTFYHWLKEKREIINFIKKNGERYTREQLFEVIQEAEKIFIDTFKKGYFEGWKNEGKIDIIVKNNNKQQCINMIK